MQNSDFISPPVTFDTGYRYFDPKRQAVVFYAYLRNTRITCYVSREALRDCFEAQSTEADTDAETEATYLGTFERHRPAFEAKARLYIEAELTQSYRDEYSRPQTEVVLRRKDFC